MDEPTVGASMTRLIDSFIKLSESQKETDKVYDELIGLIDSELRKGKNNNRRLWGEWIH